ncbi:MAG: hypothetical protein RR132_05990, partial [Rikenellaceae bacterium]
MKLCDDNYTKKEPTLLWAQSYYEFVMCYFSMKLWMGLCDDRYMKKAKKEPTLLWAQSYYEFVMCYFSMKL